ncbi:MAG: hypothetical protein LUE64_00440 [Candidatus Gastranaerophilales bacterium]|nr:hypothetical protein [Candidatus Gastranaerophilales bacterium]
MADCLNKEKINPCFELTSKIIGQSTYEKNKDSIDNYISTVEQTKIATKEQNSAIRSLYLAGFALNGSSALNSYNSKIKKEKLSA